MQLTGSPDDAVSSLIALSAALVGVAARSLPETAEVSLPQWRALVVVAQAGDRNAGAVARQLGVTASTLTRLCDRLVAKGLLRRDIAPDSRREVVLRLTPAGRSLVEEATGRRRQEIAELVGPLSDRERRALVSGVAPFLRLASRASDDAWQLGWADGAPAESAAW